LVNVSDMSERFPLKITVLTVAMARKNQKEFKVISLFPINRFIRLPRI